MFTGIVEEVGRITGIRKGAKSSVLQIEGKVIFEDLKIGDSVAAVSYTHLKKFMEFVNPELI